MTTILLISLISCYLVQVIATGIWHDRIDEWFALSKEGLREGRIYQLVTFQFMHAGLWHLLGNMLGLYFFGQAVEEFLGKAGLLKLYLASGTIGGFLQVAFAFTFPRYFAAGVVGASAGVFGLVAAFATHAPDEPITWLILYVLPVSFKAKVLLLIEAAFAVFGLLSPFIYHAMDGVAQAAHLGGMITGIVYIRMLGKFAKPFEFWRPFAKKESPPPRELVGATPRRVMRNTASPAVELPPAEFISREVDPILEKISAHGIHSLTESERKILEAARRKMAKR
jgi:membrane associated rhomboid family serine protease